MSFERAATGCKGSANNEGHHSGDPDCTCFSSPPKFLGGDHPFAVWLRTQGISSREVQRRMGCSWSSTYDLIEYGASTDMKLHVLKLFGLPAGDLHRYFPAQPRRPIHPVKKLRFEMGLTIKQFAAKIGIAQGTVVRLERYQRCRENTQEWILQFFEISIERQDEIFPQNRR